MNIPFGFQVMNVNWNLDMKTMTITDIVSVAVVEFIMMTHIMLEMTTYAIVALIMNASYVMAAAKHTITQIGIV